MVKRSLLLAAGRSSPRREPPRVRCCLPMWKVILMVPMLLGIHILFLLRKTDLWTIPSEEGSEAAILQHQHTASSKHQLRDSFQSSKKQKLPQRRHKPTPKTTPAPHAAPVVSVNTADYLENLKALEKNLNAKSCRRKSDEQANDDHSSFVMNGDFCSETATAKSFIYYNSLPFERIICGVTIPPNAHILTSTKCPSPAHLFAEIPQRTGNMKPVQLSFSLNSRSNAKLFPCDVPCLSVEGGGVVATRYVAPIDNSDAWKISFSMEGPAYYSHLEIRPGEYKKHHYYSTTSYDSEVPLPYFSWAEYDIHSPAPVDFDTAIKGASFMAKNCASRNKREQLVQELSKYVRVDALSTCLHNAAPPPGANLRDKVQTMRFYLFHLAFENQNYLDYITEKLWGPMQSGTIPIYFGSPNAKEHAPNNSLIMVDDFPSVAELGDYLNQVANNRTLFEFHQQWRNEPLPPHFHARYDFTHIHSTCRTCRWAYSKFYGLGWNHRNQSLCELEVPRYPCVNPDGQIAKPFTEQWLSGANSTVSLSYSGPAQLTCYENESEDLTKNVLVIDDALRRVVWQQDGVIDMMIEALHPGAAVVPRILQFGMPLAGAEEISIEQIENGHVRLQNGKTRFSVLTWPKRNVELKKNGAGGIVEVSIDEASQLLLRLRIIVEDVDTLRKGADKDENFFGDLMKRDFFNPVEVFLSTSRDASY